MIKKVYKGIIPSYDLIPYVRLVLYGNAYFDTYKMNVINVKEEITHNEKSGQKSFILTIECEDNITDEEVKGKQA